MATSFYTRKALGKRYAKDPALQLEQDKLRYQYSLAPGRESLAAQKAQYAQSLAFQEEQAAAAMAYNRERDALNYAATQEAQDASAMSSMIGTGANLAMTAGTVNAMKGKPFFSNPFSSTPATTPATTPIAQTAPAVTAPTAAPVAMGAGSTASGIPSFAELTAGPAMQGALDVGAADLAASGGYNMAWNAPTSAGAGTTAGVGGLAAAGYTALAAAPFIYGTMAHPKGNPNVTPEIQAQAKAAGGFMDPERGFVPLSGDALEMAHNVYNRQIAKVTAPGWNPNPNLPGYMSARAKADAQASAGSSLDSILFGGGS